MNILYWGAITSAVNALRTRAAKFVEQVVAAEEEKASTPKVRKGGGLSLDSIMYRSGQVPEDD